MILPVGTFATSVAAAVPAICRAVLAVFAELRLACSIAATQPAIVGAVVAGLPRTAGTVRAIGRRLAVCRTRLIILAIGTFTIPISAAFPAVVGTAIAVFTELRLASSVGTTLPAVLRAVDAVLPRATCAIRAIGRRLAVGWTG